MANSSKHDPHHGDPARTGSVELPRATSWPIVISLGITLMALGVATSHVFTVVGGVVFAAGIVGFIGQLLPGRGHEHEPLVEPAAQAKPAASRPGFVEQLKPGVVGYRFQLPEKVHPVSAGIKGGILGGVLMALTALVWGVWSGNGIWFPVNLLAGLVSPGVDELPPERLREFHLGWLAIGIVLHAAMSVGLGLIYGVILPTLPPVPGGPLLFGGVILPLLWTGASYGMMGIVNPVLNDHVVWRWYVASQLVYGVTASIVIMLSEKIPIAPRGHGDSGNPPPTQPSVGTGIGCLLFCLALVGCNDNLPGKPTEADRFVPPSSITDFKTLYSERCAACHGDTGRLGAGPPLNDPLFVALVSDSELEDVIANGRAGTLMPAWSQSQGGPLTAEQIAVLAKGIKERAAPLEPPGDETQQNLAATAPPLLTSSTMRSTASGDAAQGAILFETACAQCHGKQGMGDPDSPRNLRINDPAFLSLMSDTILRRYVITGRADLKMPNFAGKNGRPATFQPLTESQVADIVALLASWRTLSSSQMPEQ